MKRFASILLAFLTACSVATTTAPKPVQVPEIQKDGTTVIMSPRFKADMDSLARWSIHTIKEQVMCAQGWSIVQNPTRSTIRLDSTAKAGPYVSDPLGVYVFPDYPLCSGNGIVIHTHIPVAVSIPVEQYVPFPSALDSTTVANSDMPFGILLAVFNDSTWRLIIFGEKK